MNKIIFTILLAVNSFAFAATTDNDFTIKGSKALKLNDSNNSNNVQIKAPADITTNYILTLPVAGGTNGQVLTSDGAGTLTWTTPAVGTETYASELSLFGDVLTAKMVGTGNLTVDLSSLNSGTDTYATTASLAANTLTINRNGTSSITVDLSALNNGTETYASSLSFATPTNVLTIGMVGTNAITVDLSALNNTGTSVSSATFDSATWVVELTKTDATTLSFDLSAGISTDTALGTSTSLVASQSAVKSYVDTQLGSATANIWQEAFTATTTVNTITSTIGSFTAKTISKGRLVELEFSVPYQSTTDIAGGLMVGIFIKVNSGSWLNLGNIGYTDDSADLYTKFKRVVRGSYIIDAVANAGVSAGADYTLQVALRGKTTNDSVEVNPSYINNTSITDPDDSSPALQTWASDQNFVNVVIKEL